MRTYRMIAFTCAALVATVIACGGKDIVGLPPQMGAQQSGSSLFATDGHLCGLHVAFQGYADGAAAEGRAAVLSFELAVCGDGDVQGSAWQAIAAGVTTNRVALAAGEGATALLTVDADRNVLATRDDGSQIRLGRIAEHEVGYPVELEAGVEAGLYVDGRPFDLSRDDKSSDIVAVVTER
jgi:hypothetical protein